MIKSGVLLVLFWFASLTWAGSDSEGMASYYADSLHGKLTASGVPYDKNAMSAAHRSFPFGTRVRVVRLDNGDSVDVVINDRGPFVSGRIIDLSRAAAVKLDMIDDGLLKVRLELLEHPPP